MLGEFYRKPRSIADSSKLDSRSSPPPQRRARGNPGPVQKLSEPSRRIPCCENESNNFSAIEGERERERERLLLFYPVRVSRCNKKQSSQRGVNRQKVHARAPHQSTSREKESDRETERTRVRENSEKRIVPN